MRWITFIGLLPGVTRAHLVAKILHPARCPQPRAKAAVCAEASNQSLNHRRRTQRDFSVSLRHQTREGTSVPVASSRESAHLATTGVDEGGTLRNRRWRLRVGTGASTRYRRTFTTTFLVPQDVHRTDAGWPFGIPVM